MENKESMVQVSIRLKQETRTALEALAKEDRRSFNAYIRLILEDYISQKEKS